MIDEFTDELRAELEPEQRKKLDNYSSYGHVWPYLLTIAKTRLVLREFLAATRWGCEPECECSNCARVKTKRWEAKQVLPVRGEEDE